MFIDYWKSRPKTKKLFSHREENKNRFLIDIEKGFKIYK